MARKKHYRRLTGFWRSDGHRALAIALFWVWLCAALQGEYRLAVALAVAIVLIETI
jgi:hypothetical protein